MKYIVLFLSIFTTDMIRVAMAQDLAMADKIYDNKIETVQLYLFDGTGKQFLNPAVASINSRQPLILEFDDLREDALNYNARIYHCNADWTQSNLNNLEFLSEYNEFFIEDYEYSFDTRVYYVHYKLSLPKVKLPGNYVVAVYPADQEDEVVFTKRFMIYSQGVAVGAEMGNSTGVAQNRFNQQIEFTVNYGNYDVPNPLQDIKVVMRQNQRWDNVITNLEPTLIREDQNQLIYRHFNLENNFSGGNEYRFFDLRSVNFGGQNVGEINIKEYSIEAFLVKDRPRGAEVYSQYVDLNGQYIIESQEGGNTEIEAEYVDVHFFLEAFEPYSDPVFIFGELTNWNLQPEARMQYQPQIKGYTGTLRLKQGWYNYQYFLDNPEKPFAVEGTHFETENDYEIFVYYKPPTGRADLLVGYQKINYNPMFR